MAGRSDYTNADIMLALTTMQQTQGRIEEKVDTVTQLAKHTNGRVTTLEQKQIASEAVENYKKDQPVIQHADTVTVRQGFFENPRTAGLVTAGIAVLLALAGYLTYLAGGR